MSAQYRPYRDEDSVDGLEATSWTNNEPGTIQIYEKTTEELPFNSTNKKALWIQVLLYILTGILGFILGYFGPCHQTELITGAEDGAQPYTNSKHSDLYEDPTIKDKLLSQLDGHNILKTLERYKNVNRIPGSHGDHEFAKYVQNSFNDFGLDPISIMNYTFKTILPEQGSVIRILDKDNKTIYSTNDRELKYEYDDMIPFLPLSQAEETMITTNQLLYLNKGSKDDYAKLSSLGMNLTETEGKVLVIRQTFYRAHDVIINAQESGASAIILFPDPDTYGANSPFPEAVQLPNDAARSHPLAWSNYGDLASLNLSSLNSMDASKLGLDKESKVHIPVVLVSFNTARSLLIGLAGPEAPKDWNCFDFTLHLGPTYREENSFDSRSKIRIEFYNKETTVTTTTVTGIIAGAIEPDRYIVIGSRRDSLNRGLLDSVSGSAVMLEIARVYGHLVKQGWQPRRTIVFSSFGAESLNLIGSSNWLEAHQRLLHSRAVAYINCDQVVTGNHSVTIAASPLLYQVLYNATQQVPNPGGDSEHNRMTTVYDAWKKAHSFKKTDEGIFKPADSDLDHILESVDRVETKLHKTTSDSSSETGSDNLGFHGSILSQYKRSASVKTRPRVRRLDLQSIYSPFFLYAGIPVVDVRYTGFNGASNKTNLIEDTLPLIGTKYDNMATIQRIDPHLKYHVAVAQVLSEILRDLSDSVYLPFNLLDYAITLRDSYSHFVTHYGKIFEESNLELESLKKVIQDFAVAAAKFHQRQDRVDWRDPMQIRKFNDQMILIERAFLDPSGLPNYWERKHIILAPNDGQDHREGFPGLVDWITLLEGESLDASDYSLFVEVLKVHYKAVVYTISNAIKIIDDVHLL